MVTLNLQVKTAGIIFDGARSREVLDRAMNRTIAQLLELGEQRLDQILRPRPAGVYLSIAEARKGQASTGHYRRSVHAVQSHLHGRIDDSGVVYGPWLEGISHRNDVTRFKGYASFRRTGQWLESQAERVLDAQVNLAVRDLNAV